MKRTLFALLFFAATFAVTANAQRYGSSTCGLMPGPCMERYARQAYAPADFYLNNGYYGGYGYGYGNGRLGVSTAIGAAVGFTGGYLVGRATSPRREREYVSVPNGGQYYAQPVTRFRESKPQKPLDCRKPSGKNKTACEAAAREQEEQETATRQEAERQALANSPWRLYNRSGFTIEIFDGNRPLGRMRVNQSWRVLEPTSGFRAVMLQPDFSGGLTEAEARIRPANDFQGWVITAPRTEE